MKQNIYDDPVFFAGYREMREKESGLNVVLEQPAMRTMLPSLAGTRILDLGCGFGQFCRFAIQQGASRVTGVDISRRMLDEAKVQAEDMPIKYVRCAVEDYEGVANSADIVVSSLTLHYVRDYAAIAQKIYRWLANEGRFVFSVEHPMCTALLQGWCCTEAEEKRHWPVDHYGDEGQAVRPHAQIVLEGMSSWGSPDSMVLASQIILGFPFGRLRTGVGMLATGRQRGVLGRLAFCLPLYSSIRASNFAIRPSKSPIKTRTAGGGISASSSGRIVTDRILENDMVYVVPENRVHV